MLGEEIVAQARTWIGTPFHHQGRVKGKGCDCIGMVMGAIAETGAHSRYRDLAGNPIPFNRFDYTHYAADPSSTKLAMTLDSHLTAIDERNIQPGDVLLFKIVRLPQHVAIVGNHPMGGLSLIHAYSPARKVVEERYNQSWQARLVQAYSVPLACYRDS
jgi:NlpC/P60 family putative phage cell wall peptidase